MSDIILIVVLIAGLSANVAWTVFLFRKNKSSRAGAAASPAPADLDAHVERLLTEIHRVTSANVELLEGRIDALREVGCVADERLKRIRATLTDLEVLLNRVSRVKKSMSETPDVRIEDAPPVSAGSGPDQVERPAAPPAKKSRSEVVEGLYRQGLSERQIAQKTGLGIAEIRFLLKFANVTGSLASPVESR